MKILLSLFTVPLLSFAQVLGDPVALTQRMFTSKSVEQHSIILSEAQLQQLSKGSQQSIDTKLYRLYIAKNDTKTLGYGVLVNKKVRTKTAISLYLIGTDGKIKSIEIVAFNEPIEYLPTKTWLEGFDSKSSANTLRLNQDIPTVSGATLSARAITDGSRIALTLIDIVKP